MTNTNTTVPSTNVPLLDVARGNRPIRDEVLHAIAEVFDSGRFLYGPQVGELENEVASLSNTAHAVGCASGSDALLLSLMALDIGPGDEVILPSFTFFATASCVHRLGADIVFCDIDPKTFNVCVEDLARKITTKTRAIIPVHLFGQSAAMDEICNIANEQGIAVVEDAAQAIGAAYHGRPVGSWGTMGCISFYPTKNLGGFGDGGMIVTQSEQVADRLRLLAGHGMRPRYYHSEVGINSRLDTFQAAALLIKIQHLDEYTKARQQNACRYFDMLESAELVGESDSPIQLPFHDAAAHHVWNQFSIRVSEKHRDPLRDYLKENGVGNEVYYPIPLHQQKCFTHLGYGSGSLPETELASKEILNLPIFPELEAAEQQRVVECLGLYFSEASQRAVA